MGCRIGIASGRVTSGVVGFFKPQYTIIGDTVNVANRMQSTCLRMRVQVNRDTYNMLRWWDT